MTMFESIRFKNFQVLRDATLPLGRFTLIVGPNGSGKSTVFRALQILQNDKLPRPHLPLYASAGVNIQEQGTIIGIHLQWGDNRKGQTTLVEWVTGQHSWRQAGFAEVDNRQIIQGIRFFYLDARQIAAPTQLLPQMTLQSDGSNLAGVLDRIRDQEPERFELLNSELGRLLPEFDRILFATPSQGVRSFELRTKDGQYRIPAHHLSQGTLLALAILTLAYMASPPPVVCLEEPDRGIHPRLLRDIRDAIYRLSHPESCGESRVPVQVIATTHSPYMLDLFRDHPEEIVIANKTGLEAKFERLSDRADLHEILKDSHLGDAWYSGILGGVPCNH